MNQRDSQKVDNEMARNDEEIQKLIRDSRKIDNKMARNDEEIQ